MSWVHLLPTEVDGFALLVSCGLSPRSAFLFARLPLSRALSICLCVCLLAVSDNPAPLQVCGSGRGRLGPVELHMALEGECPC